MNSKTFAVTRQELRMIRSTTDQERKDMTTSLMKGKAVAATSMNAPTSAATSKKTDNKITSTSAATFIKTGHKVYTTSAATSMKIVDKVTARSAATSMNTPVTNNIVTTLATSTKIGDKVTARSSNSVTTKSPATSMKAAVVNKVSTKIATPVSKLELGRSSKPIPIFVCDICTDSTALEESFSLKRCDHKYCKDCVNKYVASRLGENIAHISCPAPDCKGELEPDHCRSILPQEVFVKWCEKLCEATVQGFAKLYCPYKDCSGLLIDDGTQMIKESECPHCRRLFCAQCKVPWHSEIGCEGFQKLHMNERQREDIMLMNLAETKLWKRCPNCKMYVERTSGCRYMKCRCGAAFCYGCGTTEIDLTFHYCHQCRA